MCAAKPPTSTAFAGCALDADCPRGDYCKLGACGHDCLTDVQCTGGTICDVRGQCVTEVQASQPSVPQPLSKGVPAITPAVLDFGSSASSLTVALSNSGGDPFLFRALSSQPWLSVTPFEGSVSGQPVTLTVTIDRTKATASSAAFVAINTTAGSLQLPLKVAVSLDGEWTASFVVEQPISLGTHAIPIILQQQGTTVTGWIDGEHSAIYPVNAAIAGALSQTATPELDLNFEVGAAAGTPANPVVNASLDRLVQLTLTPSGATTISGTFKETIKGLVGAGAVVSGHVSLSRVGPVRQGTVAPAPTFSVPPVPDPFLDSIGAPRAAYASCGTCPGTACSTAASGFASNSQSFLNYTPSAATAPAALTFFGEYNSIGYTGVDACIASGCPTARFDPSYLRCAQYWAVRSAREATTSSQSTFIDLVEVPADAALFDGNSAIGKAHDSWFNPTGTLVGDAQLLQKGVSKLEAGLFSPSAGSLAMGDPGILTILAGFPAASVAHNNPFPTASVSTGPRAAGEAVRRALNTSSIMMLAANDLAFTQRKMSDDAGAKATLTRALIAGYYAAAGLGQLVALSPTTWAPEASELATRWNEIRRSLDEVSLGRNALGYAPGYVPFLWKYDSANPGATNYTQIKVTAAGAFNTWKTLYGDANNASRQFESSQASLLAEFSQQTSTVDSQLKALCGSTSDDLSTCGSDFASLNASEVAQLWLETQVAAKRVEQTVQQAQNIYAEIKIEEDRAAAEAQVSENNAMLIRSTGEKIAVKDRELATINAMQNLAHNVTGCLSAVVSGNPGAALQSGLNAGVDVVADALRTGANADKAALQVDEQAKLEFSHMAVTLINSAATIKTKHLAILSLRIDQDIAVLGLAQANGRAVAAFQKAQALVAERKRQQAVGTTNIQHALSYRVFSDYTARQALVAGQEALRWAFLQARALDYQLNQSVALPWTDLWKARSPNDLQLVFNTLDTKYGESPTTQPRTEVISLRDKLLLQSAPIKDPSTGRVVDAKARFRAFVASPANRDVKGNFHIHFSTVDPSNPIFSSALGSDRITSIRVNLVGDSLGAGVTSAQVTLVHGGTSYLRSIVKGPDGTAPLTAYDVSGKGNLPRMAIAQAGINAPSGSPTLQENIEMRERAVLATDWELFIDQTSAAPANTGLDLSGLDDIEITFTHDAYTIQ